MDEGKFKVQIETIEEFPFSKKKEACNYVELLSIMKNENEKFFVVSKNKKFIVKKETIIFNKITKEERKRKTMNTSEWTELEYAQLVYLRQHGFSFNEIGNRIKRTTDACSKKYEEIYQEDVPKYFKLYEEHFGKLKEKAVREDVILKRVKHKFRELPKFTNIEIAYLVGLKSNKIKSNFWNQLVERKDANVLDFKKILSKLSEQEFEKYLFQFNLMLRNSEYLQDKLIEFSALNEGYWTAEDLVELVYYRKIKKLKFREFPHLFDRSVTACQKKIKTMTKEQLELFYRKAVEKYGHQ